MDQARPSTAQADRLILEEFQWQRLGEEAQAAPTNSSEDLLTRLASDYADRPSTAQAEQLVQEEIHNREAQRQGSHERPAHAATDNEGGWWKSMLGSWFEGASPVDATRPSTAQVEQLVAEEINATRPSVQHPLP